MIDTKYLDGTRFLLALWVLLGHFYIYAGATDFIYIPVISQILRTPGVAVDGFMLITGFLMAYNFQLRKEKEPFNQTNTWNKFWLRRFFRLYPLYLVVIIVAFFAKPYVYQGVRNMLKYFSNSDPTSVWNSTDIPTLIELATNIFMIQGLIPDHTRAVHGVTWSLSLEMQFYLVFPILFLLLFKSRGNLKNYFVITYIISLILMVASNYIMGYFDFFYPSFLIAKLPLFLVGMIASIVVFNKENYPYLFLSCILIVPFLNLLQIVILFGILLMLFSEDITKYLPDFTNKIIINTKRKLSNKTSHILSDYSYSLYLTHPFIVVAVPNIFIKLQITESIYMNAILSLIGICAINILICYLAFNFIERPMNRYGRNFIKRYF